MFSPSTPLALSGQSYQRHQSEQTLLYQIVEQYYPEFKQHTEAQGQYVPSYIQREFDEFLKCGRLEYGFIRVRCEDCHHERLVAFSCKRRGLCPSCGVRRMVDSTAHLVDEVLPKQPMRQWVLSLPFQLRFLLASYPHLIGKVLGIVYRCLSSHQVKSAGFTHATAKTGAVTLVQRFGSSVNLNIHYHMIFLDGIYVENKHGGLRFKRCKAPSHETLQQLVHRISHRVARYLEKQGYLQRDEENSYALLDGLDETDAALHHWQGCAITYRIAMGSQTGRKVMTLQTLPATDEPFGSDRLAKGAGFSLHAGVSAEAHERDKVERLCRYITRPAISEQRLALTSAGKIRYQLKTPYQDGTTHVVFEPLDFIAKLAALIPKPRVNLTRYHGVFSPNSQHRAQITPAQRGKGSKKKASATQESQSPIAKRAAMNWARRLKRVFDIDIETCERCQGHVKVIACIEDPEVIEKILMHLADKARQENSSDVAQQMPETRGPPECFDEVGQQIELFGSNT